MATIKLVTICLLVGFAAGKMKENVPVLSPYLMKIVTDLTKQQQVRRFLIDSISTERLRDNLHRLTKEVHVAGTDENFRVLDFIQEQYKSYGLQTTTKEYDVLLSSPDYKTPNQVSVRSTSSDDASIAPTWEVILNGTATKLGPREAMDQLDDDRAALQWNGYAAGGTAIADRLVYANYGRPEDFEYLDHMGVDVNDSIVLIRYGKVFRGNKVTLAENRGAVGVILYSDPADSGPGSDGNHTSEGIFPNGRYMPRDGTQRGNLKRHIAGDMLTRFYPSKPYTFRTETVDTLKKKGKIPRIPVMPVGSRAAGQLFARMNGLDAPTDFRGGIDTIAYKLNSSLDIKLSVNAHNEVRRIRNVIATLPGLEEPDRLVLLTNHVDAWTFGALDPNSGTTTILEVARVLSKAQEATNWRPRRTIMFVSADAEEFGVIGTQEWVEEHLKVLEARAVSLFNVDTAIKGNLTFYARGSPLLHTAVMDAARVVPGFDPAELALNRTTVYDTWRHYDPAPPGVDQDRQIPLIRLPRAGSDDYPYLAYAGIPAVYTNYVAVPGKQFHALYHSMYEIPWVVEQYIDPGYQALRAVAQVVSELTRSMADSVVIPFDVALYGRLISEHVATLVAQMPNETIYPALPNNNRTLADLTEAADGFRRQSILFQRAVELANDAKVGVTLREVERLNSRMVQLERSFIEPRGLYPGREMSRHLLFAAKLQNPYSAQLFPGIADGVAFYADAVDRGDTRAALRWAAETRLGFTKLQYAIESATLVLKM